MWLCRNVSNAPSATSFKMHFQFRRTGGPHVFWSWFAQLSWTTTAVIQSLFCAALSSRFLLFSISWFSGSANASQSPNIDGIEFSLELIPIFSRFCFQNLHKQMNRRSRPTSSMRLRHTPPKTIKQRIWSESNRFHLQRRLRTSVSFRISRSLLFILYCL